MLIQVGIPLFVLLVSVDCGWKTVKTTYLWKFPTLKSVCYLTDGYRLAKDMLIDHGFTDFVAVMLDTSLPAIVLAKLLHFAIPRQRAPAASKAK